MPFSFFLLSLIFLPTAARPMCHGLVFDVSATRGGAAFVLFLARLPVTVQISQFLHIKLRILVPHPLLARLFTPSGMTKQSSLSLHPSLALQS
jgi:hypothetical protein